ncbi:hypothetical protein ANCDUO_05114 [Ancylostoma duodenale]|uniref:Ral GTPase-activating protein subunit alpha/beta N-terminal domain-containing protein n=1 Tax=Ancylostoma duodenale TaxID=51022 RepID=A0A0C2H593_9BILA|nr:hypothetical protein ANCDUO_05114 [Ancylostoma duodenale]
MSRDVAVDSTTVPRGLAIERQAREVETVLDAIRALTHSASRKYQNEVWARTLSFLLNSADLLLADPLSPEEMGMRVGSRVVDTLFDLWFHAVLNEEIPSPTYWRTLAALCRRWRHHVTVVESWARKLLALTVLVCRKMYGEEYCRISIHDESILPFAYLPPVEEEDEVDLLYHNGGIPVSDENMDVQPPASLPLCFFLATTALQRMIDVSPATSKLGESVSQGRVLDAKQSVASGESMSRPLAVHFVAHTLAVNPAYIPWVGEKGPKAERLLSLTMDWLLAAARAKTEHKGKAEVADVEKPSVQG